VLQLPGSQLLAPERIEEQGVQVMAVAPIGSAPGQILIFFAWVIWFWILIRVFADLFRRHDISGWGKAGWTLFVIVLPFLGVFIYLIANGDEMGKRDVAQVQASQAQFDDYVRSVSESGGFAARDRQGQAAARQRSHHAGRVRQAQGEGARLTRGSSNRGDVRSTDSAEHWPSRSTRNQQQTRSMKCVAGWHGSDSRC
jgi:hypothetical protein